eukprot:14830630-Alexandrium_andersonii.AAC.1
MSASLVGSEMCIRDRVRHVSPPPSDSPKKASCEASKSAAAPLAGMACGPCLLYTSDAADDM